MSSQQSTSGTGGAVVADLVNQGSATGLAAGCCQRQRQAKASPEGELHVQRQELRAFVCGARLGAQQGAGTRRRAAEDALAIGSV